MKTQLLCTFSTMSDFRDVITDLNKFYTILFNKVYVLKNIDDLNEVFLTYNIDADFIKTNSFFTDTISVHRKKDSNTIYTINSLNRLIKNLNGGILDNKFPINWSDYENCILLNNEHSNIRKISTKLHSIEKL